MDQDEITAQVYQVIKNNPKLSQGEVFDKIIKELPNVDVFRILISIKHLSEA